MADAATNLHVQPGDVSAARLPAPFDRERADITRKVA
jgi:hypothetical protein